MQAKYFNDTDTLLIKFSDHAIANTYDLNEIVNYEHSYNKLFGKSKRRKVMKSKILIAILVILGLFSAGKDVNQA
jgi:hypothetical protein